MFSSGNMNHQYQPLRSHTQTWSPVAAQAGTSPWPQVATPNRLLLSTLESPIPSFFCNAQAALLFLTCLAITTYLHFVVAGMWLEILGGHPLCTMYGTVDIQVSMAQMCYVLEGRSAGGMAIQRFLFVFLLPWCTAWI